MVMDNECELCCVLTSLCSSSTARLHGEEINTGCCTGIGSRCVCIHKYPRPSSSPPFLSFALPPPLLLPHSFHRPLPGPRARLRDIITALPPLVVMWKWRRGK